MNIRRLAAVAILILAAAGYGYYKLVYRPRHPSVIETDYVISPSLDVLDTYAPVHSVLDVLKAGDPARIIRRGQDWDKILLANGKTGWVLAGQLIGPKVFAAGKALLDRVSREQAQAAGHTSDTVNLHVEPAREAALLSVLAPDEKVEMFDRRMVELESAERSKGASLSKRRLEAWYLVRTDSEPQRAGWVLGRLITLDIPPAISQYAQAFNLVAWRPFAFAEDNGQRIPEYAVVDRLGSTEGDFDHVRVFTWWASRRHYVTAFVESGLHGTFPITAGQQGSTPYFCLRLTGEQGEKFEKFYGLFHTVVRPIGTLAGWQNNAAPPVESVQVRRRRR